MAIGTSEYSIGCAQNTSRYIQKLIKTERNRTQVVRDLCQRTDKTLFSSNPGAKKLEALCLKFKH